MKKRGKGIGISFYGTGYGDGFPDISRTRVELLNDGRVGVYVGGTEVGQGAKTVFVQIAAETIKTSIDKIVLFNEDTSITPDAGTAAASRQTYNTGNAIKKACESFIIEIKKAAREILNLNSDVGLQIKDGEIYLDTFPEKKINFESLAKKLGNKIIKTENEFVAQTVQMDSETGQGAPYWPYTFNACAVEVEVDTLTGEVQILQAKFAQDVGKAINPRLIEGQMDGGFAMALGYVLLEDLGLSNGKIKNSNFSRYLIPTSLDMIDIKNIIIEDPHSTGPYGAKGIGEPVMIPVGPAILNAIYNAIGVRITEIPATPEKIIEELNKKYQELV